MGTILTAGQLGMGTIFTARQLRTGAILTASQLRVGTICDAIQLVIGTILNALGTNATSTILQQSSLLFNLRSVRLLRIATLGQDNGLIDNLA
jgi:hypothetical protein